MLQLSAGLESSKCSRPTAACGRSLPSCARRARRESEVERARAYAAGARTIAFENTGAVARHAAQQTIVYGEDVDPDAAIDAARQGHLRRGQRSRRPRRRRAVGRVRRTAHRRGARVGLRRRIAGAIAVAAVLARVWRRGATRPSRARTLRSGRRSRIRTPRPRRHRCTPHPCAADRHPSSAPLRAALTRALTTGGPQSGAAGLRPTAKKTAVLAPGRASAAPGIGREAVHDGRGAAQARPERAPPHGRVRRPATSDPAGCGTATCTCVAAATRRSATAASTRPGSRATARPPSELVAPARARRDPSRDRVGDRRRVAVRRSRGGPATGYAPDVPDFGGQLGALTYDHGSTFKAQPGGVRGEAVRGDDARRRDRRAAAHGPAGAAGARSSPRSARPRCR